MDLNTIVKNAPEQSFFFAKPTGLRGGDVTKRSAQLAIQHEQEAEEALLPYCSFPEVRRHPHRAALEAQSRAWLADLYHGRLPVTRVQRLLDARLDTLGCVFYPHGSSDARSLTLSKLSHWYILLDDVLDDPHLLGHNYEAARRFACRQFKAMFGSDMTAMKTAGLGDDAGDGDEEGGDAAISAAKAQQELVIEVGVQWAKEMRLLGMSPSQLKRLPEAVADYLAGMVGMVRLRQEKRIPELEEYIPLRRMDGARKLYPLGCEFDLGIELDKKTLEHPLMQEMHRATSDQLLWINDLLSFEREYGNDEDYVSLLGVLHHKKAADAEDDEQPGEQRGTDFTEALNEARAMIKAVDQERVRLASEIAAWRPDLTPYVQAIHFTITGINFWSLWSKRH